MINRKIEPAIRSALSTGIAVILLGARQVGKTTLADSLFGSQPGTLLLNGDEPLTGRKREFILYPLSFGEMADHHGLLAETSLLEHRLVFGYYPEVVCSPGAERNVLNEISDSYLYKDILALDRIRKSDRMTQLLRALAFQIGSQVSYTEIGRLCGLDNKTIEHYITVLEQAFVIFRLGSYSRNLRNELKASRKIYFVDNGIRNSIIADYRPIELRDDIGKLWENFLVSERIKRNRYLENHAKSWFWRTHQQQEIDYIEELDGQLRAYEFKWSPSAKLKGPKPFFEAYPGSSFQAVHRDNFSEFLL